MGVLHTFLLNEIHLILCSSLINISLVPDVSLDPCHLLFLFLLLPSLQSGLDPLSVPLLVLLEVPLEPLHVLVVLLEEFLWIREI